MNRGLWAVFFPLVLAAPAWAQTEADRAFAQCGAIADSHARLACYDAARDQSKATHWPEFSTAPAHAAPPPVVARVPARPMADGKLTSRVTQYSFSQHGQFTIVLDNGEVWRQLDSDDGIARFKHSGANVVQISKGFWGSYDMKLNTANDVFKVARVK
jgi:hypothetical protein